MAGSPSHLQDIVRSSTCGSFDSLFDGDDADIAEETIDVPFTPSANQGILSSTALGSESSPPVSSYFPDIDLSPMDEELDIFEQIERTFDMDDLPADHAESIEEASRHDTMPTINVISVERLVEDIPREREPHQVPSVLIDVPEPDVPSSEQVFEDLSAIGETLAGSPDPTQANEPSLLDSLNVSAAENKVIDEYFARVMLSDSLFADTPALGQTSTDQSIGVLDYNVAFLDSLTSNLDWLNMAAGLQLPEPDKFPDSPSLELNNATRTLPSNAGFSFATEDGLTMFQPPFSGELYPFAPSIDLVPQPSTFTDSRNLQIGPSPELDSFASFGLAPAIGHGPIGSTIDEPYPALQTTYPPSLALTESLAGLDTFIFKPELDMGFFAPIQSQTICPTEFAVPNLFDGVFRGSQLTHTESSAGFNTSFSQPELGMSFIAPNQLLNVCPTESAASDLEDVLQGPRLTQIASQGELGAALSQNEHDMSFAASTHLQVVCPTIFAAPDHSESIIHEVQQPIETVLQEIERPTSPMFVTNTPVYKPNTDDYLPAILGEDCNGCEGTESPGHNIPVNKLPANYRPRMNASKPWVKTNASTRGLNKRSAKIDLFDPTTIYDRLDCQPPSWGPFEYTHDGELEQGATYTALELRTYLYQHPLHTYHGRTERRRSRLRLWIQRAPADSARRRPAATSDHCRWDKCPQQTNAIRIGHYRVCFDEQGWKKNVKARYTDPFINAGYVHLYCLEKMMDFPAVARDLNVRAECRRLKHEQDGVNKMDLGAKEVRLECEALLQACRTDVAGEVLESYPRMTEDWSRSGGRPYEGTLNHRLQLKKIEKEQPCRQRKRERLGDKGTQIHNHLGNLEAQIREKRAMLQARRKRARVEMVEEEDNWETGECTHPSGKRQKTQRTRWEVETEEASEEDVVLEVTESKRRRQLKRAAKEKHRQRKPSLTESENSSGGSDVEWKP